MGRLVVSEFLSLDGVFEAPGGEPGHRHTGWVTRFPDQGQRDYKFAEAMDHEALLLGRVTWESFAGAWPDREPDLGEFAVRMNAMPKYVVSSTLRDPSWNNTHVLEGDPIEAVRRLKQEVEGDLLVAGSGTLVRALHAAGLVDEYRLMVFPVVLGSGRRLFGETDDLATLELAGVALLDSGTVILTYRRPASAAAEATQAASAAASTAAQAASAAVQAASAAAQAGLPQAGLPQAG